MTRRPVRVLVARMDSDGDVLLAGPAVRAVAASGAQVTMLCGPKGSAAAALLPGVTEVLTWAAPWVDFDAPPVRSRDVAAVVAACAARQPDRALILTSYHQSPLPLALLLRLADVPFVAAISEDFPGALLDVRHRVAADLHERDRALSLAAAVGYRLPAGDDGRLAVRRPLPDRRRLLAAADRSYVVVHPGARVPARRWGADRAAAAVDLLHAAGWPVVVTGGPAERPLTARVAGRHGMDLGGRTTLAELAAVLAGAAAVVVGNTGPAQLAAAVGTPVVSLFAPVVPAGRWSPAGVPVVLLGDQDAPCRDTRARDCPVPGHPCLDRVPPAAVLAAVQRLAGSPVVGGAAPEAVVGPR